MAVDMQYMPQKSQAEKEAYYGYMEVWRQELEQNWKSGYVQMPNQVRNDPLLSQKAKIVYEQLLSLMWFKTDHCWPSQATIAEATGYSRRSVIRACKELYLRGYIEKWRPGLGATNVYFINPLSFAAPTGIALTQINLQSPENPIPASGPLATLYDTSFYANDPPPPLRNLSEVPNCHKGSDKEAQPRCQNGALTIRNNEDASESNGRYIRSGVAALGGEGVAAKAIGNDTTPKTRKGTNKNQQTQPIESKPKPNTPVPPQSMGGGAAAASKTSKYRRKKHAPGDVPPPLPDKVVELLESISLRFCDESPASSKTSMAWLYDDLRQRGLNASSPTFVNLLNEAIDTTVNRTPTIRALNKDGSIAQMRYFWSVFERSVNAWCKEHDVVPPTDPGEELQSPASVEQNTCEDSSLEDAPATDAQELLNPEMGESDLQLEQAQSAEMVVVPEPPIIDDTKNGWSFTNAHHFARQLRDLFGQNDYLYEVRPVRRAGHYGFVIKEIRGDKRVIGEFSNIGQLAKARKLAQELNVEEGETKKRLATIPRRDLDGDPPTESQEPTADTPESLAAEVGAIHKPDHPHRCGCTVYYLSASGSELCARCLPQRGIDDGWYERLRAYYRVHLHLLQ